METLQHYILAGLQHVIPLGFDHVLFIISLFFLNSHLGTALIQCSLFTVAHSLTLALVSLGVLSLSATIVEPLIAISIFVVAFENTSRSASLSWHRLVLVFLFGLLHGMGFASALAEFGLPKDELVPALVGFNLGVEIAQVLIIVACYALIARPMREREWYHRRVVAPLSTAIASVALYWAVQRFLA